ncbi:MAG TPA: N-6 DNA methylase [Roseiarcus sp.]|jgi:hypothetical protein|nr:N-6 DNA methylase [Roseiarcus sp.]
MARRDKSLLRLDAVRVEGALIQPDILASAASGAAEGQSPESYGIDRGLNLRDEIGRAYLIAKGLWATFQEGRGGASPDAVQRALANGVLTKVLGFEFPHRRRFTSKAGSGLDLLQAAGRVPVAFDGTEDIDHAEIVTTAGGDSIRRSATTLVQGELNSREGALWGVATNGLTWRILRDNESITRPGYIEIDLARIFRDDLYADFSAFWLIVHGSRFPQEDAAGSDCVLERWRQLGREQGVTARDDLRDGVQKALFHFGRGFLENTANRALVDRLNADGDERLTKEDFFRQLLRLVYRLIFVMTAEDREILHPNAADDDARTTYANGYATGRLRERSRNTIAWDRHHDAYEGMNVIFRALRQGQPRLALPALGGLFAADQAPDLDVATLTNKRFLRGFYHLAWLRRDNALSRINWRDMETEEFGSVYESLLELMPVISDGGRSFSFLGESDEDAEKSLGGVRSPASPRRGGGNQRRITGSYYTPDTLVQLLLDQTLDPVIQRMAAGAPNDPEILLKLKVLDPACGSGHFLLGAARRIARKLAELRHAGSPSMQQYRHALRDVALRCIHGVDRNPMAIELCKAAIWIETVEPGKPLTFIDSKIRCGDALVGVSNFSLIGDGIPDSAYAPQEPDDAAAANHYRRLNRAQRDDRKPQHGQGRFPFMGPPADLVAAAKKIETMPEEDVDQIDAKYRSFMNFRESSGWSFRKRACDLWTAAFFAPKTKVPSSQGLYDVPLTDQVWLAWSGSALPEPLRNNAESIAEENRFLHWPLEFADVIFEHGGFDVVLGNPPWETMSPDVKEFFAPYDPEVRFMGPEEQKACVEELKRVASVREAWDSYCLHLYLTANFLKNSGRYSLFAKGNLGKGDFNVYRMFVELALGLARKGGRAGQLVPENLYNGANAAAIRARLFKEMRLHSITGFENTGRVWFDIDTRQKFCLYVAEPAHPQEAFGAAFNVNSHAKALALKKGLPFSIPISLVEEFSPEALAISEVAHASEVEVARKIYATFPKFGSGWDEPEFRPYAAELHMGNDRDTFTNIEGGIPVFEGRMVDIFDHRAKAYVSGRGRAAVWRDLPFGSAEKAIVSQWRISEADVPAKNKGRWLKYRGGFCDVASPTNQRALVCALIPAGTICGDKVPTILLENDHPASILLWLGVANSLVLDFVARKKVGLKMSFTLVDSLPLPKEYQGTSVELEIAKRSLLLSATGSEMEAFLDRAAREFKMTGDVEPVEDINERSRLRAEIDVLVARDLAGLTKDEIKYVLDPGFVLGDNCGIETFGALKRAEIREFGAFVTADRILKTWDTLPTSGWRSVESMAQASAN